MRSMLPITIGLRRQVRFRSHGRAVSAGNDCGDDAIFLEICRTLDRQQMRELRARPIDPALDRARRTSADLRRLVIRKSGGADHDEYFALLGLEFVEGLPEFMVFRVCDLVRLGSNAVGMIFDVFEWPAPPAAFGEEVVLHDR